MPSGTVTPSAADYSTKPLVERHKLRGRIYTLTELPIAEYDKLANQAITKDEITGRETSDDVALMKLLVLNVVDISPREYASAGTRVILRLNSLVRAMHFGEEPEELIEDEANAEKAEGDAKGNA